jgi:hypothetical protein
MSGLYKAIIEIDAKGLIYNPLEPQHLDGLLAWCLQPFHTERTITHRDEIPDEIPLPLRYVMIDGQKVWKASAILPMTDEIQSGAYFRKRLRTDRVTLTKGSPNQQMGVYHDCNIQIPVTICRYLCAYFEGNASEVRKLLKRVKSIGRKREMGYGKVISVDVEPCEHDYSLVKDGFAMRFLPDKTGFLDRRMRAPYWNNYDKVPSCQVGDHYNLSEHIVTGL